jgi:hypothetical protein
MTEEAQKIAAYRAAVHLMAYEGRLSWQATSVFIQATFILVAASVFPSFLGSQNDKLLITTALLVSIFGIFWTITWGAMVGRSRRYHLYWLLCARELETTFADSVKTLQRGKNLAKGNTVIVDGEDIGFRMVERIRMTWAIYIVYFVFMVLFIFLAIINLIRIVETF